MPSVTGNDDDTPLKGYGVKGTSAVADGVLGISTSDKHAGVSAINDQGGFGIWVRGRAHFEGSTAGATASFVNATAGCIFAETTDTHGSGAIGAVAQNGPALSGFSSGGIGVDGASDNSTGMQGKSKGREGVHGESSSATWAGVAGIQTSTGPGVWGSSQGGEGIHGETNAQKWAAIAAINRGGGPGLWASGVPAGHFEGDISVTGKVWVTGQVVANDVWLTNADCAEEFPVKDEAPPEPGTVVVFEDQGLLEASSRPYDPRVAGVVAGAGGRQPAIILGRDGTTDHRAPLALLGRVFCKVDASTAPISVGDLLTTSARAGHAMRADPKLAAGSILGKALQGLETGIGMIPILVCLR
jgi:hypothetical protein